MIDIIVDTMVENILLSFHNIVWKPSMKIQYPLTIIKLGIENEYN